MQDPTNRYRRQLALPEIGPLGQQRLRDARVLVIGAGGLGCPALQFLVGAGIGTLGIVDGDRVSEDNLHRQLLFPESTVGLFKVDAAKRALLDLNTEASIITYPLFLTRHQARELVAAYDVVLDCTDNEVATLLIDDACFACDKPHIHGGIDRFQGQVGVFNHRAHGSAGPTRYRDVFGLAVGNPLAADCEERGTVGVVPGIIGTLQASEAIKLILGIGSPLVGQLLVVDVLHNEFQVFST